ncbi:hypothetical protein ACFL4H_01705 [Candidatus Neomarinimicrobiota bacterium]
MLIEYQILDRLKRIEKYIDKCDQQGWMDINQAVKYSGISIRSLSRAISAGRLKVSRATGKRMFKTEWIDCFMVGK